MTCVQFSTFQRLAAGCPAAPLLIAMPRISSWLLFTCCLWWCAVLSMAATKAGSTTTAAAAAATAATSSSVVVFINGSVPLASVNDDFLCANMDWWAPEKCDYGICSWPQSSVLNLNLSNHLLQNAVKALSPLKIRIGGTLQDRVVYEIGDPLYPCEPFNPSQTALFGFSGGCLPMWRWDQLNNFFQSTGANVAFGLNGLYGRPETYTGPWNSTNARDFIQYTHDKGYSVFAWELGNELSGSVPGSRVLASQYASDIQELNNVVKQIYENEPSNMPLRVAPDGYFDESWLQEFLQASGPNVVSSITNHIYPLGPSGSTDLVEKVLDPTQLDSIKGTFQMIQSTIQQYGWWARPWVGEAGGSYNSGRHLVTDAFISSFWFVDQLGMSSSYGFTNYCRQTLIGGNYGLLDATTFQPNPDFYSALLWHRLMGGKVLETKSMDTPYLRAYSHCSKEAEGVVMVLINLSNETQYNVYMDVAGYGGDLSRRTEYHLTPKDGWDVQSQTVLLNGVELKTTLDGQIPSLQVPPSFNNSQTVTMQPLSIAFISLPITLPACSTT